MADSAPVSRSSKCGVDVAFAADAGFEVVFKIAVLRGGAAEFFDGGFCERGAAQVGVQDYAGGIDDRSKRAGEDSLYRLCDVLSRALRN